MSVPARFELRTEFELGRLDQLVDLLATTWWAAARDRADVEAMLAGSDLIFAMIDLHADRLVGFARVITDDVYLAMVLDVTIAPAHARSGLGSRLIDAVVDHPRVAKVESLEVVCQPDLVTFYERWGFTADVGRSTLMRRTDCSRLIETPH